MNPPSINFETGEYRLRPDKKKAVEWWKKASKLQSEIGSNHARSALEKFSEEMKNLNQESGLLPNFHSIYIAKKIRNSPKKPRNVEPIKGSWKLQTETIDRLKYAAQQAREDPGQFLEKIKNHQMLAANKYKTELDFNDELAQENAGKMVIDFAEDAASSIYGRSEAFEEAAKLGISLPSPSEGPSFDELLLDKINHKFQFMKTYGGIAMTIGGKENMTDDGQLEAARIIDVWQKAENDYERLALEAEARLLCAKEFGGN